MAVFSASLFGLIILVLCVNDVTSQCQDCDAVKVPRVCTKPVKLGCPTDYYVSTCTCCPVCFKGFAQLCGGKRNLYGKCQQGLRCQPFGSPSFSRSLTEKIENTPGLCLQKFVR